MARHRAWIAVAAALVALAAAPAAQAEPLTWWDATDLAVAPDGKDVYVGGGHTLSFRVNPSTGALTLNGYTEPSARSLAISPDGRFVYAAPSAHSGINILTRDAATGILTHRENFTAPNDPAAESGLIDQLVMAPDGSQLYAFEGWALVVYDRDQTTGALTLRQMLFAPDELGIKRPTQLAVAPDGDTLYLSGQGIATLHREPGGDISYVDTVDENLSFQAIGIAPDGERAYAGGSNYRVFDRDPVTGELTDAGAANLVDQSCFSCEEGRFISVAPDGGAIFSAQEANQTVIQATPTQGGATLAHQYVHGQDGDLGLLSPVAFDWSADGQLAFVVASKYLFHEDGLLFRNSAGTDSTLAVYRRTNDGLDFVDVAGPNPDVAESPALKPGEFVKQASVTIDGGAIYTNDRTVDVKVERDQWASSLRLANSAAGLPTGSLRRITRREMHFTWQLEPGPSPRSVKRVFVRFTPGYTAEEREPVDISDDIVLDQTEPEVVSAVADGKRLLLAAHDNRSGVVKLQVARDRAHPGRLRAFARRVKLSRSAAGVLVRVVDGAGNRSPWRRAQPK